ncbi:MAG: membrane protein insertion efficiency factor YidD [Bacteroidetes bacterium]|nr:membrane protein insertion efficiency factor YidD [Bacteroidota bacterium]MBU1116157.1 membrane protein insertion efficiency factor YidD [Bacteroidota bacterium]MBU1800449.1 membrane protein insertion efficiency factor YidD [Bacteroidota bacterium]
MSFMQQSYSFLISDLDGDNCPFYPTCSSFFVQSVNETNIIKGTLMFADRFTRDSNIFKSRSHYPKHISGKLFDPIQNYLLTDSTIIFHSREKTVK